MLKSNQNLLSEHGGPIELSKEWAHTLLRRMGFVKRKETSSESCISVSNLRHKGSIPSGDRVHCCNGGNTTRVDSQLGQDWNKIGTIVRVDHGGVKSQKGRGERS